MSTPALERARIQLALAIVLGMALLQSRTWLIAAGTALVGYALAQGLHSAHAGGWALGAFVVGGAVGLIHSARRFVDAVVRS